MHAIGMIESNSIAKGIDFADVMAKTAAVTIVMAKSICPGKYIVMVTGDVAAVSQSVATALEVAPEVVVDSFVIPNVHPSVIPAISGGTVVDKVAAIGVLETYSVSSTIEATDVAVKTATVTPLRMHLAFGIGGKSYVVLTGDVAAVTASVTAGAGFAGEKGMLVNSVVIPRPHDQVVAGLL